MKKIIASLLLVSLFAGTHISANVEYYSLEHFDPNEIIVPLQDEENPPAN